MRLYTHTHARTQTHTHTHIYMMSSLQAFTSHAQFCSSRTDHAHPAPPSCCLMLADSHFSFLKKQRSTSCSSLLLLTAPPHCSSSLPACSSHIYITAWFCFSSSALRLLHTLSAPPPSRRPPAAAEVQVRSARLLIYMDLPSPSLSRSSVPTRTE